MTDECGVIEWPADLVGWRARRTPDRVALVDADSREEWTYAAVDQAIDRVAAYFGDAGVRPDATVATVLDTRPASIAAPFAAFRCGATLAPLNAALDSSTLAEQLDRLDPALILRGDEPEGLDLDSFDAVVLSAEGWSGSAAGGPVDSSGDSTLLAPPSTGLRSNGSIPPADHSLSPDDTAIVAFTSGTTGRPKGVRLTLGNLLSSAVASAQRLGVSPRDRWFSPLSTYHVGGIAPYVRSTLYGTAAIFQRSFDADRTAAALDDCRATCVSFVPTMLSRVLDAGWRPGPDVRFVLLGGGPAPDSLLERCRDLDVPVCPTYGTTETASQVATATPGEGRDYPGTAGRSLHGANVRIVDDDCSVCDPGDVGELVVDGPMVSPGYLDPDSTAEAFDQGDRFHTGDLGYRDDDGRLWISGREDDVIVTGGENVRPGVVRDALREQPAVDDAAVVGVPDDEWGERVAALVVVDADVAADDLRTLCRGHVPDYALPKSIAFADELPRTPSGTVDRAAVRDRFQ